MESGAGVARKPGIVDAASPNRTAPPRGRLHRGYIAASRALRREMSPTDLPDGSAVAEDGGI